MKTIYLAGKVGGRKWKVVPKHDYVKYVSSDGGNHSEHDWAVSMSKSMYLPHLAEAVQERCIDVLKKSDALFAYLDTPYSYGSIAEIAYASALDIPCKVVVNFSCDQTDVDKDEWTDGSLSDAYWFVSNFPGVSGCESLTEERSTEFFSRYLGFVLAESPVEAQLWDGFLGCVPWKTSLPLPIPQFKIDKYRLDFAWPNQRMAVEVDGHDFHKTKEQRSYDAQRDRDLLKLGWTTLRFTGSDVFRDADAVASEIISILAQAKV